MVNLVAPQFPSIGEKEKRKRGRGGRRKKGKDQKEEQKPRSGFPCSPPPLRFHVTKEKKRGEKDGKGNREGPRPGLPDICNTKDAGPQPWAAIRCQESNVRGKRGEKRKRGKRGEGKEKEDTGIKFYFIQTPQEFWIICHLDHGKRKKEKKE